METSLGGLALGSLGGAGFFNEALGSSANGANAELAKGGGSSLADAGYICHKNPITARLANYIQHVIQPDGTKVFYVKSHLMYGIFDYPKNLDCHAAFRVPARAYTQTLKIEVVEGELSGDSYFAFGNDYGDTEVFHNIMDPAITRSVSVPVNYENRRRYSIHFHSGSSASKGYVLKFSVTP